MDFEKSSIERLKRTLYSRNENIVPKEKRTPVTNREINVPTTWNAEKKEDILENNMSRKKNSFFTNFLLGSVAFFLISLGVAAFIFFGGVNTISSDNLEVAITAPSTVSSGEELVIGLSIVNGNRVDLESTNIFIEYPEGLQSVDLGARTPSFEKLEVGVVESGEIYNHTIRAILLGEKDVVKTFNFRIEYKIKGSNATFSKEKEYKVVIGNSPIILETRYPGEINSGQELEISVDITSNSATVLDDVLVKVEYPYGFTYKDASTKPLRNDSIWNLGDLKNGDKKTLKIKGVLVGQNLEDRSFQVSVGTSDKGSVPDFNVNLATDVLTVGIRKSFFSLEVSTPGNGVSDMSKSIPVKIDWQNNLVDRIVNTYVEAVVSGNIFDRTSVIVGNGGFYRSAENKVFWDRNTTSDLQELVPGESGSLGFSVNTLKGISQINLIKNPYIEIKVSARGDRVGLESGPVSSTESYIVKINSLIGFTSRLFRAVGPITNTGPIPPKADTETTYTVTWTLTNANNNLEGVTVSADIPQGVEWKNEFLPSTEKVSYDPSTRKIVWSVGSVLAGTGFTNSSREVSFKVGVTPSVTQVGSSPLVLSASILVARDMYTNSELTATASNLTTKFNDPSFKDGQDDVIK